MSRRGDTELIYFFFKPRDVRHTRADEVKVFAPGELVEWLEKCAECVGVPMFRTRFRKDEGVFYNGEPAAYAICWNSKKCDVPTVLFTDVPPELWLDMAGHTGDWERILKYFTETREIPPAKAEELREKVLKARRAVLGV